MGNICVCPTGVHNPPTAEEIEMFTQLCDKESKSVRDEGGKVWDRLCGSLHDYESALRRSVRQEMVSRFESVEHASKRDKKKRKVSEDDDANSDLDDDNEKGKLFETLPNSN
jgi:hypothetical protein